MLLTAFLWPMVSWAQAPFEAGKDYVILDNVQQDTSTVVDTPVIEFFNYGCPACANLEPTLEAWLQQQSNGIAFTRVPVVFNPEWQIYARAYYIAKALDIEEKVSPALFKSIHEQHQNLSTPAAMAAFFAKFGVNEADFNSVYQASPLIDAEMAQAKLLSQTYRIRLIPTFVVGGKYKTNASMVGGDNNRLMQVLDYLIKRNQPPAQS